MTSGSRAPTTKERENNKRRERKRRAIAARIFAGLRQFGNYKLPKHCDNNEVLKALCREAGWTVEEDGTTYKQGCKPVQERADACMSSTASPASSSYTQGGGGGDGLSLIPWLKGLSSSGVTVAATTAAAATAGGVVASSSRSSGLPPLQMMRGGTCSAPVTPPLSSPRVPYVKPDWTEVSTKAGEVLSSDCAATAFSNAYHGHPYMQAAPTTASGSSTPTYPPVFIVSGTSTPSHFLASGSQSPFHPSGTSTPTHSSYLRNLSSFNFTAAAAAAVVQQPAQDRESVANAIAMDDDHKHIALTTEAGKLANNLPMESEKRAGNTAVVADCKRVETAMQSRRWASVRGDGSMKSNGAVVVQAVGAPTDKFPCGNRYFVDQPYLCSWPQSQSEHQAITALAAAALPDARSIVPEGFRVEMGLDSCRAKRPHRSMAAMVKPWEGETIHEVSLGEEELELTLGNSTTKGSAAATPEVSSRTSAMSVD